ncbi:hypothetical protein L1987_60793 [Smallanthus sonchifolius]|uniref:Uncharacterized protein n=1 Tax=Smallanthus sonchifolius TaxID=185202 RepID=A0ACB9D9E0_9ASTR|nr:hypothetical protein L1987_60793 [Smallanthus sonchifolius]
MEYGKLILYKPWLCYCTPFSLVWRKKDLPTAYTHTKTHTVTHTKNKKKKIINHGASNQSGGDDAIGDVSFICYSSNGESQISQIRHGFHPRILHSEG